MKNKITDRHKWFTDRVGKIVFRNKTSCPCQICKSVYEKGCLILDEFHADFLYQCESEYTSEGYPLKYFNTKEEVETFELLLKK